MYKQQFALYENGAIAESTVSKWLTKFQNGNFDLEHRERSSKSEVQERKKVYLEEQAEKIGMLESLR